MGHKASPGDQDPNFPQPFVNYGLGNEARWLCMEALYGSC